MLVRAGARAYFLDAQISVTVFATDMTVPTTPTLQLTAASFLTYHGARRVWPLVDRATGLE
jgi:hypothetical protein